MAEAVHVTENFDALDADDLGRVLRLGLIVVRSVHNVITSFLRLTSRKISHTYVMVVMLFGTHFIHNAGNNVEIANCMKFLIL